MQFVQNSLTPGMGAKVFENIDLINFIHDQMLINQQTVSTSTSKISCIAIEYMLKRM